MIPISKPNIGKEEEKAVIKVLRSGIIAQGKKVIELEKKFARYIGTKYAVAVSSGTAALNLTLLAAGIGPGDEVITSPFSFIASANSSLFVGAKPVFIDINESDFNLDPDLIEAAITKRTKAILPIHLFGAPADMEIINKIAKRHNLLIIEDSCQAHGASIKKKKVGTWGLAGCFSLYATKNMAAGEGGLIVTNNKRLRDKCRLLRSHGSKTQYVHNFLGYNLMMTDIEAVITLEQLKKLPGGNKQRLKNAKYLNQSIKAGGVILPKIIPGQLHVFHQYTIRITSSYSISRDQLIKVLNKNRIGFGIHYPLPIHRQGLYKKMGYKDKLPVAEKAAKEVLSLPIHPLVKQNDLELIAKTINQAC